MIFQIRFYFHKRLQSNFDRYMAQKRDSTWCRLQGRIIQTGDSLSTRGDREAGGSPKFEKKELKIGFGKVLLKQKRARRVCVHTITYLSAILSAWWVFLLPRAVFKEKCEHQNFPRRAKRIENVRPSFLLRSFSGTPQNYVWRKLI